MKVSTQRNILLIVFVILLYLLIRSCGVNDHQVNTLKQNVFSLNDSLRTYKDDNGQLVYEKGALISENGNLNELNGDLSKEIKYLKDNPLVVIKTVIKVVHDTVYIDIKPTDTGKWVGSSFIKNFEWELNNKYTTSNYRILEGNFDVYVDSLFNLSTSKMKIIKKKVDELN